jgi:hypothetical protein
MGTPFRACRKSLTLTLHSSSRPSAGFAFAAFRPRPLDAFGRIGHSSRRDSRTTTPFGLTYRNMELRSFCCAESLAATDIATDSSASLRWDRVLRAGRKALATVVMARLLRMVVAKNREIGGSDVRRRPR